jgi:hypothetical protein
MSTVIDTWDTDPIKLTKKKVRAVPKRIDPTSIPKILEAFDAGISPVKIAKKLGTTPAAVRNRIRASGRSIKSHTCPNCGHTTKGE